ncbi:MAG: SpoIIE family protein phosphatase [Bacteroidota bacterium]
MDNHIHQRFTLTDRSFASGIRREIKKIAEGCGFDSVEIGKIDIIVTELTSNLVKHTTHGGEILAKPVLHEEKVGLEIICLDNGPGMRNPARMMEDGVSTAGSMGEGLGAIKRLSDDFDLYSLFNNGTALLSRLYRGGKKVAIHNPQRKLEFRSVMVALAGETVSGDGWTVFQNSDYCTILVLDGLGHGAAAHAAVQSAIEAYDSKAKQIPAQALKTIHDAIKRSRGAVGAMAVISKQNNSLAFCGVGNISSRLINPEKNSSLIPYNGTLGHALPSQLVDYTFPWNELSMLIMHSDGIGTKWDLQKYPNLIRHDPSIIAAMLYKDNQRKTDDALVIVGKYV